MPAFIRPTTFRNLASRGGPFGNRSPRYETRISQGAQKAASRVGRGEVFRHDANHPPVAALQMDGAADQLRIGAQGLPQAMTQHEDGFAARRLPRRDRRGAFEFVREERAAQPWLATIHVEEAAGDVHAGDRHAAVAAAKGRRDRHRGGDRVERVVSSPPSRGRCPAPGPRAGDPRRRSIPTSRPAGPAGRYGSGRSSTASTNAKSVGVAATPRPRSSEIPTVTPGVRTSDRSAWAASCRAPTKTTSQTNASHVRTSASGPWDCATASRRSPSSRMTCRSSLSRIRSIRRSRAWLRAHHLRTRSPVMRVAPYATPGSSARDGRSLRGGGRRHPARASRAVSVRSSDAARRLRRRRVGGPTPRSGRVFSSSRSCPYNAAGQSLTWPSVRSSTSCMML